LRPREGKTKRPQRDRASARSHSLERIQALPLSRIHAVETNPHPDPLPFTTGEGKLRWHRVQVTDQRSERMRCSSPLPARSGERIKVRGAPTAYLRLSGVRMVGDWRCG